MASLTTLREQIRRPLPLPYHPLYRFYEGGSLTRRFRGLPERPDDWWSEDWVGSCTCANNAGPDGRAHLLQLARHTVDVALRRVDIEHQGGGDQLITPLAYGPSVVAPDVVVGLAQDPRRVRHGIPPQRARGWRVITARHSR